MQAMSDATAELNGSAVAALRNSFADKCSSQNKSRLNVYIEKKLPDFVQLVESAKKNDPVNPRAMLDDVIAAHKHADALSKILMSDGVQLARYAEALRLPTTYVWDRPDLSLDAICRRLADDTRLLSIHLQAAERLKLPSGRPPVEMHSDIAFVVGMHMHELDFKITKAESGFFARVLDAAMVLVYSGSPPQINVKALAEESHYRVHRWHDKYNMPVEIQSGPNLSS
ncbi:MAG TPA: hypothetical protein V6C76_12750 [Drouetiella sp.]